MLFNIEKKNVYNDINIFSIFLVGILIYFNNETFPSVFFKGPGQSIFYLFFILVVFFFFNVFIKKEKLNKYSTYASFVLITLIFITMLLNQDFSGGYFKVINCILIGYFFSHLISLREFTASYVRVMLILALYSLVVTYIIRPLTFSMPSSLAPIITNTAGVSFIDMRLSVVVNDINYFRNFGIFREAGVYQVFLNFALIFELFFKKTKVNIFTVIVLFLTIISTFSTPGYIAALIILFAFFISPSKKSMPLDVSIKKNKRIIASSLIIIIIISFFIFLFNDNFKEMVLGTFDKVSEDNSSFQGRTVAIWVNLVVWISNPFFGSGINSLISTTLELLKNNSSYSTSHNTSTIGALLVVFGSFFTIIFIYYLFKLLNKSKYGKITGIISFLAIMISINTQLLIYNEILYTIIVFGMLKEKVI